MRHPAREALATPAEKPPAPPRFSVCGIDHAFFVTGLVGHGGAPLAGHLAGKRSDHVRRLIGLLIVHDDNAPRCLFKRQNRIEQCLKQLLTRL